LTEYEIKGHGILKSIRKVSMTATEFVAGYVLHKEEVTRNFAMNESF
jgi:hypothetical protein